MDLVYSIYFSYTAKKTFWRFLFYTAAAERNLGFVEVFVKEVTYRDRKVGLIIWPCINSKVFSFIAYLLKIQNLTPDTIFLSMSLWLRLLFLKLHYIAEIQFLQIKMNCLVDRKLYHCNLNEVTNPTNNQLCYCLKVYSSFNSLKWI